jgi:hypothetical protein
MGAIPFLDMSLGNACFDRGRAFGNRQESDRPSRTTEIVMKQYFQPGREDFRRTLAAVA